MGFLGSVKQNGSAYVLLHHIMGEAAGRKGVWAYVEGGMGKISQCILESAKATNNVEVITNADVKEIIIEDSKVKGVRMGDGTVMYSENVISACTPWHTFMELIPALGEDNVKHFPPDYSEFISKIKATGSGDE